MSNADSLRELTPAQLKRLKIMIVDPNAFMRGVVADSLRRQHVVNIQGCASAAEAFAEGRLSKPDIIFVDWEAGRMSGLEFTCELRRNSTGIPRETPIILLASAIGHEQLMKARQAGINEFLLKPVSGLGVLSRIEEIVLRPRKFIVSRSYVGPCRRRRQDPDFAGPWRRLSDEHNIRRATKSVQENAVKLRAIIDNLNAQSLRPNEDKSAAIRGMYRLLNEYEAEIRSLSDDVIGRVWSCAIRYIEGVGLTASYDPEVIRYHFQTIALILDMPDEAFMHRISVANELERLVAKKTASVSERTIRTA